MVGFASVIMLKISSDDELVQLEQRAADLQQEVRIVDIYDSYICQRFLDCLDEFADC